MAKTKRSTDIDIPGGWVRLRDPKKVPERLRRPLLPAVAAMLDKVSATDDIKPWEMGDSFTQLYGMNDMLIIALVEEWSFNAPITEDSLLDQPAEVYDALSDLCKDKILDLMPNFGISTDDSSPT